MCARIFWALGGCMCCMHCHRLYLSAMIANGCQNRKCAHSTVLFVWWLGFGMYASHLQWRWLSVCVALHLAFIENSLLISHCAYAPYNNNNAIQVYEFYLASVLLLSGRRLVVVMKMDQQMIITRICRKIAFRKWISGINVQIIIEILASIGGFGLQYAYCRTCHKRSVI